MAPGEEFTCALDAAEHASCWGSNPAGGLGNGTLDAALEPAAVITDADGAG